MLAIENPRKFKIYCTRDLGRAGKNTVLVPNSPISAERGGRKLGVTSKSISEFYRQAFAL